LSNRESSSDPELADEALVLRALAGRREAFGVLVARHERRLFRFLCKAAACEADVEDAMQLAMIKAYTKLATFDPRYRFTTWLFTIALRELRSLGRRAAASPTGRAVPLHDAPEPAAAGDGVTIADGPGELWRTAKHVLSEPQYTALWLRYGENLAAREIATVMRRPRVWVSVTLHRACATLRKVAEAAEKRESAAGPVAGRIKRAGRTAGGVPS
jgi:RNA polymerase sigma-70 factor (ECF subfamily)